MSENWKTYKLGDIIVSANTGLDAIKRAPIVQDDTGIKCLRIQDVSQEKEYNNWGFCNVSKENYKKFALKEGEIIIARTGNTIGVNMFVKEDINSVFNNGLIRIRVNKQLNYPKYLYYIFRSNSFKNYIQAIAFGTSTQPNMQIGSLLNYDLVLPPLPEQKAIASILSVLDDKIENNLAMNKTLEDMAMALYKHWFVDFGPFQEGKFVNSELGEIPEGWEVKKLPEISINHNKKRKPLSTRVRAEMQGKYPYYGATKALDFINDFRFDGEFILLAEDGTVKTDRDTPFLQFVEGQFWVSNHAHVLTGNDLYSNEFVYLSLANSNVVPIITGAVQLKINKQNLESLTFITPSTEILRNFETQVIHWFKQIRLNILETETLTKLRDTLLPKLISGEVRLKEFEEEITSAL